MITRIVGAILTAIASPSIVKSAVWGYNPSIKPRLSGLLAIAVFTLGGTFGSVQSLAQTASIAIANIQTPAANRMIGSQIPGRPFARTQSGLVIGSTTADGVNQFLGIPYAAPPVGALRWTPPKPYGSFPGFVLEATQFGNLCTQPAPPGVTGTSGSEDCLFLNIYTPQGRSAEDLLRYRRLPVMVWIHGGGLVGGRSSAYDPTRLVKNRVIVVTINYRLGYLGFFAHSAVDGEGHLNGNYGLMDQQFALQWVRDNIAGFGGDPDRVTIFGESAGGQSVYAHLASPLAAGLFHGAIVESGSYDNFQDYFDFIVPLAIAETTGTALVPSGSAIAESVGCASQTASCLRAVPASALVAIERRALSIHSWMARC